MKKISLYFWQNCVSPHQIPYIKELHKDERIEKVYLIAPISTSSNRKSMGWNDIVGEYQGVEIMISPSIDEIRELFQQNQCNAIHLFSGIRADKNVYQYFKESLKFNLKRGIITEPPFDYKTPIFLHKLRFLLYDYKYVSKIDFVFGMGDKAVDYYKLWSKRWNVLLFGYCVESIFEAIQTKPDNKLKFLFVGSLIKRKKIGLLLKGISKINTSIDFTLDIIGNGPEHNNLRQNVEKYELTQKCNFRGKLSMQEIHKELAEYDVLVLPSMHDGWGAVINEGLQSGLFIISSDNCGAKTLIEDSNRGIVFRNKNLKSLTEALNYCCDNSEKIKATKNDRIKWSEKIHGLSMSRYMVDCILNKDLVLPPWKID